MASQECTGYIELRDWDTKSHEHLAEFKTWADRSAHRARSPGPTCWLEESVVTVGVVSGRWIRWRRAKGREAFREDIRDRCFG